MYADDIILLSASLTDLKGLLNMCVEELNSLNLLLNIKKCTVIRMGKRFQANIQNSSVNGEKLSVANEVRYLGVYIKSGTSMKFNLDHGKRKCYQCINGILGRIGCRPELVFPLCKAFCIPVILYATESMDLNVSLCRCLNKLLYRLIFKLFKINDNKSINECLYYMACLPMDYIICKRLINFYSKLSTTNNALLKHLYCNFGQNCMNKWKEMYSVKSVKSLDYDLWSHFACVIGL
jgi:hypothetical protein